MEFDINTQLQNKAMQKKQQAHKAFLGFVFVLVFVVGLGAGFLTATLSSDGAGNIQEAKNALLNKNADDLSLFWDVWNDVKGDYVHQPVDEKQLMYGAVSGIVQGLNDPYSVFFTPDQSKEFMDEINGEFEGIGAEVAIKNNQLVVVSPITGSPAMAAGVQPGDAILRIDDVDTAGMDLNTAVGKIRGKKDTVVTLQLQRNGETPFDVKITRDRIHIDSVTSKNIEKDGKRIAHITISQFNGETADLFSKAVTEVKVNKPDGIILDLRNNPGGYLDAAVEVIGQFVENGTPVVYEQKSDGQDIPYKTKGAPTIDGVPTVVLMNAGSASASEIVAGALRDYKKATLLGTTSFGKGTVQDVRSYADGSTLKLTIAQWLTPNKTAINKTGVVPDFYSTNTKEDVAADKDPQLDAATLYFTNNAEFVKTILPPTEEQKKPLVKE